MLTFCRRVSRALFTSILIEATTAPTTVPLQRVAAGRAFCTQSIFSIERGLLIRKLRPANRPVRKHRNSKPFNLADALVSGFLLRQRLLSTTMTSGGKPKVVFVLGPPGSGKGTQCEKIVEKFKFVHLSAGDLLRAERNTPGSEYGELIEGHIRNGTIVPVEITCSLIEKAMKESGQNRFLIDGFPRNQNNLDGWQKEMGDKAEVLFVLFLNCSEEVATGRCLGRGQAGSGRVDDNLESLKKRFQTYQNDTMPIIKHYEAINLVRKFDTNCNDKDVVFTEISKAFEAI
ncbi:hypothetical protein BIW11_01927 [Tropilaelaps mercedesae]|uniref:UMP-CMP kinase n=1 Tax=Tropilaelaps mercedesae TaxID=418985 RepID=A0A1V9X630_9ACAR|nr:hypothetical protein BIW11_01927 [Tropilaelaps mercedesae]